MKKLYISLSLLICIAAAISCKKNKTIVAEEVEVKRPFVDFTIVPTADPFTFKFENKSANYKDLVWRFGDDSLSTDVSPEHLYVRDGIYEVNLQATSETGATARKLLVININPDTIVKISAEKTGNGNDMQFNINCKATIKSVLWTFNDDQTTYDVTSPVKTLDPSKLYSFSLKIITEKGSILQSNKFVTTTGIVSYITNMGAMSVSADNGGGKTANEGSLKIIDNNVETKWYMSGWSFPIVTQFALPSIQTVKFYGVGSANDSGDRAPKDWTLQGSNDGTNWEILDTRTGISYGNVYKKMFYYPVANPKPYAFYKWNITANNGSSGFQISEFRLYR